MALSKTSGIAAFALCAALCAATVAAGAVLRERLESMYDVDLASEEQKCFFVGTYKKVGDYQVSVTVRMTAPFRDPVTKTIAPADFTYDTGSQQDDITCWIDLKAWAMAVTGDLRIDKWIECGGSIDFQSACGSASSARKSVKSGGGSYFVHSPSSDGSLTVEYQPVVLQLAEEDIN